MASGLSARAHSKVLESATELFAERGIDATSVDNTLMQAGMESARRNCRCIFSTFRLASSRRPEPV